MSVETTDFHERNKGQAPAMLAKLRQDVINNANVFEVLLDAVRICSLGKITHALLEGCVSEGIIVLLQAAESQTANPKVKSLSLTEGWWLGSC